MKRILQKIKAFILKDPLWKAFSLVMAVFLWFLVMNTLNPTETKTFTTNLTFTNESVLSDNSITILNREALEQTRISIRVSGTRPALDELSKSENRAGLTATVDLRQLSTMGQLNGVQEVILNVTPKLPDNLYGFSYEIAGSSPGFVEAQVDSLKSQTMKVQFELTGELPAGYMSDDPVCDSDTVTITGPDSMYDKVAMVKATIDLADRSDDVRVAVAPGVYDTEGNLMEEFTVEPAVLDVSVNISRRWQIPVKEPEVIGELDEDLVLESIDYNPKYIEVEGDIGEMNAVESIQLPPVDLSTIDSTRQTDYDVRPSLKDTDIKPVDGSPTVVTVTVTVSAMTYRDISIDGEDIHLTGLGEGYTVRVGSGTLTLKGDEATLDALTLEQLNPSLDLSGLGVGRHNPELALTLPEDIQGESIPHISVIIEEEAEETTQPATEAETEAPTEEETEAPEEETVQEPVESTEEPLEE